MHAGEYKTTNFTPITEAMNLYNHVDRITSNPNKFPEYKVKQLKQEDGEDVVKILIETDGLVGKVREQAYEIYRNAWRANEIDLRKEPERKKERLELQMEAIRVCSDHLACIQLCRNHFKLSYKKIEYWGNLALSVRDKLQAWHKSDIQRFKDI